MGFSGDLRSIGFCVLVVGLRHVFRWRKSLELVVSAVSAAFHVRRAYDRQRWQRLPSHVDKIVIATSFSGNLPGAKGFSSTKLARWMDLDK